MTIESGQIVCSTFAWTMLGFFAAPGWTPAFADSTSAPTANAIAIPIETVFLDLNDERLNLWIETERIRGCQFLLEITEDAEAIADDLTEIRIHVNHLVPVDADCEGEPSPFTFDLAVQQPIEIEKGITYDIWVNDYTFQVTQSQ
ncbi:MAG: hypothetical protein AAGG53_15805 [Cyanobacteria bacterium P01_H01_bin.152]